MSLIRIIVATGFIIGLAFGAAEIFLHGVPPWLWVVAAGLLLWALFGGSRVEEGEQPGYHDKMQAICNQLIRLHNAARIGGYTEEIKRQVAELESSRKQLELTYDERKDG